jgi:hypothetical protein
MIRMFLVFITIEFSSFFSLLLQKKNLLAVKHKHNSCRYGRLFSMRLYFSHQMALVKVFFTLKNNKKTQVVLFV